MITIIVQNNPMKMELYGKKMKKYRKKYDRFSHNSYNVKRQIPL